MYKKKKKKNDRLKKYCILFYKGRKDKYFELNIFL